MKKKLSINDLRSETITTAKKGENSLRTIFGGHNGAVEADDYSGPGMNNPHAYGTSSGATGSDGSNQTNDYSGSGISNPHPFGG